jgi:hypothetical protein
MNHGQLSLLICISERHSLHSVEAEMSRTQNLGGSAQARTWTGTKLP